MKEARMLGKNIQCLAEKKGLSVSDLSQVLECNEHQVHRLLKGRAYASFAQIEKLATLLDTTVENLLKENQENCNFNIAHYTDKLKKSDNIEKILDIIDGYIDIVDSLN